MVDGLWIVQYEGTAGGDGGVIVFAKGQILGGDNAFVYTGTYEIDGETLSGRVFIRNFNPAVANVLGIDGDFELDVQGRIQGNIIKGNANLRNREGAGMVMKLTKAADLAF